MKPNVKTIEDQELIDLIIRDRFTQEVFRIERIKRATLAKLQFENKVIDDNGQFIVEC
jgi:hypothetical protein